MASPASGTARELVCRALAKAGDEDMSGAQIARTTGVNRASVDQALFKGVRSGDFIKTGWGRYKLSDSARAAASVDEAPTGAATAVPPPVANSAAPEFAPALGTRCTPVLPENRAQGTIAQALRAVLREDAGLPLDEIFMALPMGWSRTEAVSGLSDGVHEGWVVRDGDGWRLKGEAPEPRTEDPIAVSRIPNYQHDKAVAIRANLADLLQDACRDHRSPAALSAIAQACEHVHRAIALLTD